MKEMKQYEKLPENLYEITRTSMRFDEKPFDKAFLVLILREDVRHVDCPSKIPVYGGGVDCPSKIPVYGGGVDWWYKNGSNHRIENGLIKRDMKYNQKWVVEINCLDDLLNISKECGQLVINAYGYENKSIEIYDDYRE